MDLESRIQTVAGGVQIEVDRRGVSNADGTEARHRDVKLRRRRDS
jgi:hypothetical protein